MEKEDKKDLDTLFQGHQRQYAQVVIGALSDGYKGHAELVDLVRDLDTPEDLSPPWELNLVLYELNRTGIIRS